MKKIILLFALVIYSSLSLIAQNVPQGMNYQAVARNLQGQTLANQEIFLRINLRSNGPDGKIVYTEIHQATTNDLGLFALIIGEGTKSKKLGTAFDAVPWSEAEIWMELAIDEQGGDNFQVLNVSRLMSVPYAFHAGTASRIKDLSFDKWMTEFNDREKRGGSTGIPFWTVWGNSNVDTNYHWMGTSVAQDVIFKGNNIEAIRIKTDGSVNISGPSTFGDDLFVRRNLTVGQNTTLRGMLGVQGSTTLGGTLDVTEAATLKDNLTVKENTILEGTLDVTETATLKDNLTVKENTILEGTLDVTETATLKDNLTVKENTILEGTLDVTEAATLKDNLTVKENTILEGTLDVTEATTLKDNLTVEGETTLKDKLTISNNIPGDFIFSIENTNGEDGSNAGDGMRIKLGRTHPAWDGTNFLDVGNPAAAFFDNNISTVKGWFRGEEFKVADIVGFHPIGFVAGAACGLVEDLAGELNTALGLPLEIPKTDILLDLLKEINGPDISGDGVCDTPGDCLVPDELVNPELSDGAYYVGEQLVLPGFSLKFPDDLPCGDLPRIEIPNLSFVDVANTLTSDNQFISFVDKSNRPLGSIRASSVSEWFDDYFDGVYFVNFMGSAGKLDPLGIITGVVREVTNTADSYNAIGVEYTSGHGDYAEWLERQDPDEIISRGDIVAVVGGKITKDLAGAEQVMAVSEHPIVLGNMPPEGKTHLGNNVAFMGQIPVKVMGPVASGDYIVANEKIPGYGVAIHPADIKVEHTPYIVGRSWESRSGAGPKMVNTVIGVHNGDYFRILQKYEQKFKDSEARFDILESKVDRLLERVAPESN